MALDIIQGQSQARASTQEASLFLLLLFQKEWEEGQTKQHTCDIHKAPDMGSGPICTPKVLIIFII